MSERYCGTCGKPLETSSATATDCPTCEAWWKENPPPVMTTPNAALADERLRLKIRGLIENECVADAAGIVVPQATMDRIMRLVRQGAPR